MSAANNSNESYCTFTLASDVTAGGLPSEEEIAKQLESNDPKVCMYVLDFFIFGGSRRIFFHWELLVIMKMIIVHSSYGLICCVTMMAG